MMDLDLSPPPEIPKPPRKANLLETVFSYVNSITETKQNIMYGESEEKEYIKARFLIHRALSFSRDLLVIVNRMNRAQNMDARTEYELFLSLIPAKSRRNKWIKRLPDSLYLKSVCAHYGCNPNRAEEMMKLLTIEQMAVIEQKQEEKRDSWTIYSGGSE